MRFLVPEMLWLLTALPLIGAAGWWLARRRALALRRFAGGADRISRFTGGEDPRHLTLAAASAVSATIPIMLVILFFQKNLVKGLTAGAVKG